MKKNCVRCNETEGQYQPDYGWHFCGTCYEEHKHERELDGVEIIDTRSQS